MITGHETTSGLLSFAFMRLLQNPKAYLQAQQEIDAVIGDGPVEAQHLKQLKYLNAVLRETLRLTPTATGITKLPHPDRRNESVTICDGKYRLDPNVPIRVLLGKAMCDPSYFGEDAAEFNPDRMIETNPNFERYMKAWKPFGNGSRSCIGQNFAWQEAVLVAATVLQNFDMSFADTGYQLHIKQALTIKPANLYAKVKLRNGVSPSVLANRLYGSGGAGAGATTSDIAGLAPSNEPQKEGLTILYGSNSGTCFSLAQKLASAVGTKLGLATAVHDLDFGTKALPTDHPVVIITASYEGQPPDNAARFVEWLESSQCQNLQGIKYSVFGCGHKDWRETLHRIPKLVDKVLAEKGAERVFAFGSSDVSAGAVLDDFAKWQDGLLDVLQSTVAGAGSASAALKVDPLEQVEIRTDRRAAALSSGLTSCKVTDVRVLTAPGEPEKRHMEIELPPEAEYECGDYLAVLPVQPDALVKRIMAHWRLPWDATIVLNTKAFAPLPEGEVLSIWDVLKGYVELGTVASRSVCLSLSFVS